MVQVTTSKLKADVDEILRQIQTDGEQVDIVRNDEVIARIVPVGPRGVRATNQATVAGATASRPLSPEERAQTNAVLDDIDRLAAEIGRSWPESVTAVDAVRDVRREL